MYLVLLVLLTCDDPWTAGAQHPDHGPLTLPGTGLGVIGAFAFGLLGSSHCLGRCGPLVTLYTHHLSSARPRFAPRQHLLYNLGRVIVYTDLGLLLGGLGQGLGMYPHISGALGLLAGGCVVAMGARFLGIRSAAMWVDQLFVRPTQCFVRVWHRLFTLVRSPGIMILGGLHGPLRSPLVGARSTVRISGSNPSICNRWSAV
jgi:sulfite exporter TauE/SafE